MTRNAITPNHILIKPLFYFINIKHKTMKYLLLLLTYIGMGQVLANSISIAQITHSRYCDGFPTGAIDLEVESPYTPFTFVWSGPDEFSAQSEDISGLAPGNYCVTVTDNLCGVGVLCVDVLCEEECPLAEITQNTTLTRAEPACICEGASGTYFNLETDPEFGPYTFLWSGPEGFSSERQNPDDISMPGLYTVQVINDLGCSISLSTNLYACPGIQSLTFEVLPDCGGSCGSILTQVTGGAAGLLNYQWSNGQVIPDIYHVAAGDYRLTVTDQHGCSILGMANVPDQTDTPAFVINATVTPACIPHTGSIVLNLDNVPAPVTVNWSYPEAEGNALININSGTYRATVTDANGCGAVANWYVSTGPVVREEVIPNTCFGTNDGSIRLTVTGSFHNDVLWEDGNGFANQLFRQNLPPGEYCVNITSPDGCEFRACYSTNPTEPTDIYPYLKQVTIMTAGQGPDITIYDGQWIPTSSGCLLFSGDTQNLNQELVQAMGAGQMSWRVVAVFSEVIGLGEYNIGGFTGLLSLADNFTINVLANDVQTLTAEGSFEIPLLFTAFDSEGNPIINMYEASQGLEACVNIPAIAINTCEWAPDIGAYPLGTDKTHRLEFKCINVSLEPFNGNSFCLDFGTTPANAIAGIFWKNPGGQWILNNNPCYSVTPGLYGEYCALLKTSYNCSVELCATYCKPPELTGGGATITNPDCPGGNNGSICLDISADPPLVLDWGNGGNESRPVFCYL